MAHFTSEKFAEDAKLPKWSEGKLFKDSFVLVVLHVKPFDGVPGKAVGLNGCCLKSCLRGFLEKLFMEYATHCWLQDTAGTEGCRSHPHSTSLSKGAHYATEAEKPLLPPASLQCPVLTKLSTTRAGKGKIGRAEHAHFYYLKTVNEECLGPLRQQLGNWFSKPFPLIGKTLQ